MWDSSLKRHLNQIVVHNCIFFWSPRWMNIVLDNWDPHMAVVFLMQKLMIQQYISGNVGTNRFLYIWYIMIYIYMPDWWFCVSCYMYIYIPLYPHQIIIAEILIISNHSVLPFKYIAVWWYAVVLGRNPDPWFIIVHPKFLSAKNNLHFGQLDTSD